jgi:glycerol-3-phosphate responsive antiterminator
VVVADDDAIAMARVVDLVEHVNGTIVHVEILPGTVAEYLEAVARAAVISADK